MSMWFASVLSVGREPRGSSSNRVLRPATCRRPIVRNLCPARTVRSTSPIVSGLGLAVSRSPALSGYRGMRDPEAAEAVDFTVHADENDCITGDTCKGQRDRISNLTQAMSADIFRVEFHAATSKAKPLAGFIQEVQYILIGLFVPNPNR